MPSARATWTSEFTQNNTLSDLRASVKARSADNPCKHGLRSVCWKAFLVFENLDLSTWPKILRDSRSAYNALKEHFIPTPERREGLSALDPLADDISSPWHALRKDETLRAEILQDVERCMPDNPYFRETKTQEKLLDILFIYCKLNMDVGYRQGMHEILAPILWVVSDDAIDTEGKSSKDAMESSADLLSALIDPYYMEHDAFTLFCIIMQTAKSFYETGVNAQHSAIAASTNSPIVERSRRIHEEYLRQTDPELANHLHSIDILPQIFVIRWIRLLFGREFAFEDVLCLWDVLFAEDPGLDLVDFVCVAMLLRIRWQLLRSDYSSALTILLRYPIPKEPHGPITFIEDAMYIRDNLSSQAGEHLISKYSGKTPKSRRASAHTRTPRSPHRTSQRGSQDLTGTSPLRFPGQIFQDSRIEDLIQGAAKGVYKQSERLGLNQAFRDAVQGLQSGSNSPRRPTPNLRWSLDRGRVVEDQEGQLRARITTIDYRNQELAKLLQAAMEDLSIQIDKSEEPENNKDRATALALILAKIQYVQIYLEDPSLPLGGSSPTREESEPGRNRKTGQGAIDKIDEPSSEPANQPKDSSGGYDKSLSSPSDLPLRRGSMGRPSGAKSTPSPTRRPKPRTTQDSEGRTESPLRASFQQSRPSLAQSSFSWMLGNSPGNAPFGASSPFSPEQERKAVARGKAGFLFGDQKQENASAEGSNSKAQREDSEGFTLGTLKGLPKQS